MDKTIYTVDIKKLEEFKGSLRDFAYIVYNEKKLNSEVHKPNKLRVFVYDDGKQKSRLKSLLKKYGASDEYIKEVFASGKTETIKENMNTDNMDKKDAVFESAREVASDLVFKYGQKTKITEEDIVETFSDAIEDVYRREFMEIDPHDISWDAFYEMVNDRIKETNDKGLSLESIDVVNADDLAYLVYILTDEQDKTLFDVDDAIAASDYTFASGEHYTELTPELIPDCISFYQGWEGDEGNDQHASQTDSNADNSLGESTVNEDGIGVGAAQEPYDGFVKVFQCGSPIMYGVMCGANLVFCVTKADNSKYTAEYKYLYPNGEPIRDPKVLKVFGPKASEELVKQINSIWPGYANIEEFKADVAAEHVDEGFCYVSVEDLVNESKKEAREELLRQLEKEGRLVTVNEGRELPKPSKAPKGVNPTRMEYRSYISADKKAISEDIAEIKTICGGKCPLAKDLTSAIGESDVKKIKEIGEKIVAEASKKSDANRISKLINHIVSCVENIINIKDILDSAKKANESVTARFAQGRKMFEGDGNGDDNKGDNGDSSDSSSDNNGDSSDNGNADDNKGDENKDDQKSDDKKDEEVIDGDRLKVTFTIAEGHDRDEVVDAIKKDLDNAGIPEDGIEILDADDEKSDEIQVIVNGDYISELKSFCDEKGIDLEEKLGGEIEIDDDNKDDKKDDDKKDGGDDKSGDNSSDDSGLFSGDMLDDIFGTDLDNNGEEQK